MIYLTGHLTCNCIDAHDLIEALLALSGDVEMTSMFNARKYCQVTPWLLISEKKIWDTSNRNIVPIWASSLLWAVANRWASNWWACLHTSWLMYLRVQLWNSTTMARRRSRLTLLYMRKLTGVSLATLILFEEETRPLLRPLLVLICTLHLY